MDDWDVVDTGSNSTLRTDMVMGGLGAFVLLFLLWLILMIPRVPPTQLDAEVKMPGNIMGYIRWPDGIDVDVDFWVKAPNDSAVGYSNRAGKTFNLLRDDLGNINDSTELNYEVVFGRDQPDGEYVFNIHLYRNGSNLTEIPVEADIHITYGSRKVRIATRKMVLKSYGEEQTIVSFTMKDGKIVGEPSTDYKPLRAAGGI